MKTLSTVYFVIAFSLCSFSQNKFIDVEYRKTADSKLVEGQWLVNLAESKVVDDDLLISKLTFLSNIDLMDSIERKLNLFIEKGYSAMSVIGSKRVLLTDTGKGEVDFFSTKRKQKVSRSFYYCLMSNAGETYMMLIIDIEDSGNEYPFWFRIEKVDTEDKLRELNLLYTEDHWADYRIVHLK